MFGLYIHTLIYKHMFILRKVTGSGIQSNTCLNKVYNLITEEEKEEFDCTMKLDDYRDEETKSKIYAFIVYNEGSEIIPLYKAQRNYIMCSDGKTFANISFKA